ncbi:MAG: DUF5995 family protein [Acidimicrobiales bacterium]
MASTAPDGTDNGDYETIDALLASMDRIEQSLQAADDPRRFFHSTYARTTRAVRDEIGRGGFTDNEWVERWDLVFAGLYLRAYEQYEATGAAVGPWQVAFDRASDTALPPLRHVLLGMNAHINYDLPQALCAVITSAQFDDEALLAKRGADHQHIDTVLAARVAAEDAELKKLEQPGQRTLLDKILTPFNRLGTKKFLREARTKVWANARTLDRARREGDEAYAGALRDLEALSRQRVVDLGQPGQIILRLARQGFGVVLEP